MKSNGNYECIELESPELSVLIITMTISSNLIGELAALFFSNHCVGL